MGHEVNISKPSIYRFQEIVAELLRVWIVPIEATLASEQPKHLFSFFSVCTSRCQLQAAIVTLR